MVRYNQDFHSVDNLPPRCPKCGSHRTQVVGRSNDSGIVVVRCSTCGERSRIIADEDSHAGGYTPQVGAESHC